MDVQLNSHERLYRHDRSEDISIIFKGRRNRFIIGQPDSIEQPALTCNFDNQTYRFAQIHGIHCVLSDSQSFAGQFCYQ